MTRIAIDHMKRITAGLAATIIILVGLTGLSCKDDTQVGTAPPSITSLLPTETITLAGEQFTVELALTDPARARGLMFRKELPAHTGMLFVFDRPAPRSFYMKNCLIDLDIIFIAADGSIARIYTMKTPVPRPTFEILSQRRRREIRP